jgi:CRP-like cAMP-binding protein
VDLDLTLHKSSNAGRLIFIERGIVSIAALQGESELDVAIVGCDSIVGASQVLGNLKSLNQVRMRVPGYGCATPISAAMREFDRAGAFRHFVLSSIAACFVQTAQVAVCNRYRELEQRLARTLLLHFDRHDDFALDFNQERLGNVLGVRRTSITVAAGRLQRLSLIDYSCGKIKMIDRAGPETR